MRESVGSICTPELMTPPPILSGGSDEGLTVEEAGDTRNGGRSTFGGLLVVVVRAERRAGSSNVELYGVQMQKCGNTVLERGMGRKGIIVRNYYNVTCRMER